MLKDVGKNSYRGNVDLLRTYLIFSSHRLLNMWIIHIWNTNGVFVFDVKRMFLAVVAIPCGIFNNSCNVRISMKNQGEPTKKACSIAFWVPQNLNSLTDCFIVFWLTTWGSSEVRLLKPSFVHRSRDRGVPDTNQMKFSLHSLIQWYTPFGKAFCVV